MEPLLPFFFFLTGVAGMGVSIVLISSQKWARNFYLSLCIFSLSLCTIYNFCYTAGLMPHLPFLFILAKSFIYLVAPTGYLYIRNVFRAEYTYKKFDWIHFVPFVLIIIYLTNTSLCNPQTIQRALADSSVNWFVDVSNIDAYYYLSIAKPLLWLFYTVLQTIQIINFEKTINFDHSHLNYRLLNWIKTFNISLIIMFSILLVQRFIAVTFISLDFVNDTTMSFILLLTIIYLISNPHIMYSLQPSNLHLMLDNHPVYDNNIEEHEYEDKVIPGKCLFNAKKKEEYLLMLDEVLTLEKPYLQKGITINDLSTKTKIPMHHLSNLIGDEFDLHFRDFINQRRIEYLKLNIHDKAWKHLTLEGICWQIGFTSRTTFFRAFIKFTGVSPSEYFNNIKKDKHSA